jgi:serine O-acetyltransferase
MTASDAINHNTRRPDRIGGAPSSDQDEDGPTLRDRDETAEMAPIAMWQQLLREASRLSEQEPVLRRSIERRLRLGCFTHALGAVMSAAVANQDFGATELEQIVTEVSEKDRSFEHAAVADLLAAAERDPAAEGIAGPFFFYKGYHALQWHRIAHRLWCVDRRHLSRALQSIVSRALAVDIHPAAKIGTGVFIDHGTGLVIGETAVVGNNVSILQEVTLGGTGKQAGDRHPKIGDGVLLAAGAKVLGNIIIGANAKVGAGSVVLHDVPPCATVAGVPARVVGWCRDAAPGIAMDQALSPLETITPYEGSS